LTQKRAAPRFGISWSWQRSESESHL